MSDKPNYSLIQTVLDSLQLELRLLLDPPDGTKEHPATTCLELWLCHPEFPSGQSHQRTRVSNKPVMCRRASVTEVHVVWMVLKQQTLKTSKSFCEIEK